MIMMIIIDASVSNDPSSGDDDALWRVSPPNLSRRSRFGIFGGSLSRFSDLTSRREYIWLGGANNVWYGQAVQAGIVVPKVVKSYVNTVSRILAFDSCGLLLEGL
jgi:hypothetical protein